VIAVLFVKVVVGLGLKLFRQVCHDASEYAIDGALLGRVSVPDGNEV
jgi:hypothetical protein